MSELMSVENIRAATRSVFQYISYSNALPGWFEPASIAYGAIATAIQDRARRLLQGDSLKSPFRVIVPRSNGARSVWAMPSTHEQILLQVSVASLAPELDRVIDRTRVYSFRLNQDRRLALVEDQSSAWTQFDAATRGRCDKCVLQIDLRSAFSSIDRKRFVSFLQPFSKAGQARLIEILVNAFSEGDPGLPLVNDAIFFLGSAYLSVVDKVVARHTKSFVRYMDDYRIFGDSSSQLEAVYKAVSQDLRQMGFQINDKKTFLGTAEQYLDLLAKAKRANKEGGQYLTPVPTDILDPDTMVAQIGLTLKDPDHFITDGFGRMQLASLRKMRVNAAGVTVQGKPPQKAFSEALSRNHDLVRRGLALLKKYAVTQGEEWRAVWILYLFRDLNVGSLPADLAKEVQKVLDDTQKSGNVASIVRLWARQPPAAPTEAAANALFEADYVKAGQLYYGGRS
jgi:hypothetical protein